MACSIDINKDAVLSNCPDDTELVLFFNVPNQPTKTAVRTWAQVKQCLGVNTPPIAGSVGDAGLPQDGEPTYQDDRLKGLGSSNNENIMLFIAGTPYYNYGNNTSMDYDPVEGQITLLNGSVFNQGDDFNCSTNQ